MSQQQSPDGRPCCEPLDHDADAERLAADVRLLSGAGNDTRYELLRLLSAADGGVCACELPEPVGLSQSAVSHALSTLFDAGLVTREKDGRWRYYDLTPAAQSLLDTLDTLHTETPPTADRTDDDQRRIVRERYADVATDSDGCCDPKTSDSGCCDGDTAAIDADATARKLGYEDDEVDAVAGDANLGLGCGNPGAIADLDPGETVLDLGSGAGFDCFLAADAVGAEGRVIGVDMTPAMVEKARENAAENEAANVDFRLGEIEQLPVADATADAVISNCVVNLSPDKPQVFREAFRALRPGGRLAIADVVQTAEFPPEVARDTDSLAACVAGAATVDALERMLAEAGFEAIDIAPKDDSDEFIREWAEGYDPSDYLVSATIEARKPE